MRSGAISAPPDERAPTGRTEMGSGGAAPRSRTMRGRRLHDIAAATAVASVVSGAPSTLHALVTGRGVLDSSRAAGTLLPGRKDRPGLLAGLAVHFALSGFWGAVLGLLLP